MSIDIKNIEAIKEAANEAGQPASLARRLIAWMEAVTSGNENLSDPASVERHLEVLYAETDANSDKEDVS
jgi:hypothetical protein